MALWCVEKEQCWKVNNVEILILCHIPANKEQHSTVGGKQPLYNFKDAGIEASVALCIQE